MFVCIDDLVAQWAYASVGGFYMYIFHIYAINLYEHELLISRLINKDIFTSTEQISVCIHGFLRYFLADNA